MGDDNNDKCPAQSKKPLSVRGQLEYLLERIPPADLSRFVLETAVYDAEFRETFLISFADLPDGKPSDSSRYQQRLYKILSQYTNQDGFISARNATDLNAAILALLGSARKPTTPLRESIDVSLAVLGIMPKLGDRMDDAEGYLYSLTEQTCTVLLECFDSLRSERQQECFEQVLKYYSEPEYLDLDLDSFLLLLLKDWAQQNKQRQAACLQVQEAMLDDCKDDQWRKSYLIEQTNELLMYWKA